MGDGGRDTPDSQYNIKLTVWCVLLHVPFVIQGKLQDFHCNARLRDFFILVSLLGVFAEGVPPTPPS